MKKGILFILVSVIIFSLCIYVADKSIIKSQSSNKITVVATLFPQYDFAKKIGGDKVDVKLLLTPGTESHTYEPTPQDIIKINKSDLFIYTGKYMEPWSERISNGIDSDTIILDASKGINLIKTDDDDEEEHHQSHKDEEHHENEDENHEDEEHYHDDKSEEVGHHHHEYDPHIWLDPQNAVVMVKNIAEQLSKISPENAAFFNENANKYIEEINKLDSEIQDVVNTSKNNKIAFGGTFAYAYFVNRYNLEYVSAYHSCGEDTEPSVADVKNVIDYMKSNDIKVIFYQELSSGKIAESIAKETNAKKLIFHTVHNASQEEINKGESYISIMRANLNSLKEALN